MTDIPAGPCCTDADRSDGFAHDPLTHALRARLAEVEADHGEALAEVEAERDAARAFVSRVNRVLNEFGIEYPLGHRGVEDIAAMATGRLEDLNNLAAENARLRQELATVSERELSALAQLSAAEDERDAARRRLEVADADVEWREDWAGRLVEQTPESYDCDESIWAILERWISDLAAENVRLRQGKRNGAGGPPAGAASRVDSAHANHSAQTVQRPPAEGPSSAAQPRSHPAGTSDHPPALQRPRGGFGVAELSG